MSSLYEITQDMLALDQLLGEVGGDVTDGEQSEAIEKWIKEYQWKQEGKVDAYGSMIANWNADIEAIKAETKRLSERAHVIGNRIQRLKDLAKFAMDMLKTRKLEGHTFTISIAANGGAIPVEIMALEKDIPDSFVKLERKPDLAKIRQALEANDPAAMKIAKLGVRGESVRVR